LRNENAGGGGGKELSEASKKEGGFSQESSGFTGEKRDDLSNGQHTEAMRFLYESHKYVWELIKITDTKAGACMALHTIMISVLALISLKLFDRRIDPIFGWFLAVAFLLFLISLARSLGPAQT
jgi:hypothetical protein